MKLIATATVGAGGAATISINNIPQSYTDLRLFFSGRTTRTDAGQIGDDLIVIINGGAGAFTARTLNGNGTAASSNTSSFQGAFTSSNATSNTFSNGSLYFSNYSSTVLKSISYEAVLENNASLSFLWFTALNLSLNVPITDISISSAYSNTLVQNTTVSLYGITKGSDGITTAS